MKTSAFKLPNDDIKQRYQLLAKIGSGGMGDVFLCIQRGAVDFSRLVVLKAINGRNERYSKENAKMFVNEARVVASLSHPHIVKVHDFCMADDAAYIVMEYVEGETLRYVFSDCEKRGQFIPNPLTFRWILDACGALRYAHHSTSPTGELRQIIHRDIGLHNLMIDSNGFLKIIDFGIAKSSLQDEGSSPGLIKGNPAYMAPDLFIHKMSDHRIDIYALGLCLYELLTLTRAFKFQKSATVGEVIQTISTKELLPPSQIVSGLPAGIDDVVMRAVEKKREKRYQTIDAFATDLKRVAHDCLYGGLDSKQWFLQTFSKRIEERRQFGAKMLRLAKTRSSDDEQLPPVSMPKGLMGVNSITPSVSENHTSQLVIHPGHLYRLMGALFVMFVACAGVVSLLFFRDPKSDGIVPMADNIAVSCTPSDAMLVLDGQEIGTLGTERLLLHVEPNLKHHIVVSKAGFHDYTLPFIGPANGVKQINVMLKPKGEAMPDTDETSDKMVFSEQQTDDTGVEKPVVRKKRVKWVKKKSSASPPTVIKKPVLVEPAKSANSLPGETRKIPLIDDKKTTIPLVDD